MAIPLPRRQPAPDALQSAILFSLRLNTRDGIVDVDAAASMLQTAFDVDIDEDKCIRLITEAAALLGVKTHADTGTGRFARHV